MLVAESVAPKQLRDVVQQVTDALDGDGGASRRVRSLRAPATCTYHRCSTAWSRSTGCSTPRAGRSCCRRSTVPWRPAAAHVTGRTRPQRRADALVELCRVGAKDTRRGPGAGIGRMRRSSWISRCSRRAASHGARAGGACGARRTLAGRNHSAAAVRRRGRGGDHAGIIGADRRRPDDADDPILVVASARRA